MKNFKIFLLVFVLFALQGYSQKKPNIIFIMSDDHTSQAVGVYGGILAPLNPTPVLDKLATEGVIFTNTFCTNSICTPSRASIMTGQYSQTNGVLDLHGSLEPEEQYLAIEMGKLGYETAMIGKWHLKKEPASFDYYCVLPGQGLYHDPEFRIQGPEQWPNNTIKTKGHSSDMITDITLAWLEEKRDKSKPFFLMHHYKAPHDMFEHAKRYDDYLEDVEIPEPASLYYAPNHGSIATKGENDDYVSFIGSSVSKRNPWRNMGEDMGIDQSLEGNAYTHAAYQTYLKRYLRCVKGVDDNLGRLFEYLKKQKLWDNTIIIYTGDQGFNLGEHDYIDKRWMYEESLRMPFIVHYPKMIKKPFKTDAMVNNTYFAPTIIELAGGKVPGYMQGVSFKSILETEEEPVDFPQSTYYRYWMHMEHHQNPAHFGIRTKDYKLIFFYGTNYRKLNDPSSRMNYFHSFNTPVAWEFYNLRNDPQEMNNLYGDPEYADVIADLKNQLMSMRAELNEEDTTYPNIQKIIDDHWDD